MSAKPPDHTLDAIRAMVAEHDTLTAEHDAASTAYYASTAALSAPGSSDRERRQLIADEDAAGARLLRARADLRQRPYTSIDVARHLLDVVDRQHAMLERHQHQLPHPRDGSPLFCLGCGQPQGYCRPDCALDALLRETA